MIGWASIEKCRSISLYWMGNGWSLHGYSRVLLYTGWELGDQCIDIPEYCFIHDGNWVIIAWIFLSIAFYMMGIVWSLHGYSWVLIFTGWELGGNCMDIPAETDNGWKCFDINEELTVILLKINKVNLRDLIAATGLVILLKLDSNRRFSARVTLKFDGWPRKTIGHPFYATSSIIS